MDAFARPAHKLSNGFYNPHVLMAEPGAGSARANVDDSNRLTGQRGKCDSLSHDGAASRITRSVDLKQSKNCSINHCRDEPRLDHAAQYISPGDDAYEFAILPRNRQGAREGKICASSVFADKFDNLRRCPTPYLPIKLRPSWRPESSA